MWAKLFRLGWVDVFRGFVTAFFSAVMGIVIPIINQLATGVAVNFPSWKIILFAGLAGGCGYLWKNFFTNSKDQTFRAEPKPDK